MTSVYKWKLKKYWTNILSVFNEIISELEINQVKNLFEDDETVIEILSVRINMVSRNPEFQTSKKSIKRLLQKHTQKLRKVNKRVN